MRCGVGVMNTVFLSIETHNVGFKHYYQFCEITPASMWHTTILIWSNPSPQSFQLLPIGLLGVITKLLLVIPPPNKAILNPYLATHNAI